MAVPFPVQHKRKVILRKAHRRNNGSSVKAHKVKLPNAPKKVEAKKTRSPDQWMGSPNYKRPEKTEVIRPDGLWKFAATRTREVWGGR